MKILLVLLLLLPTLSPAVYAQRGFNYYKDSSRVGSPNEKAYTYFKKAYYDCIWKWTKAGADSAEYYLKLAIKEDSNYSAAYAFLAHVYQFQTYDNQDVDRKFALQKKYAQKAMSFDPKTGDAYSVMSDVVWTEHDTLQALNLLRKAIALEPDNVGNYIFLAIRFTQMGTANDSAVFYLHRLLCYDPQYGQAFMKLGNVYNWSGQHLDSAKYYYRKAIDHYNTITPRDNRMMGGYSSLAEVYMKERKYDSAIYYYNSFVKEMEPSDMYIRDMTLSSAYKGLYECHQHLAANAVSKLIDVNKKRIAESKKDAGALLEILEGTLMGIEQDSVYEKQALPLAKYIQSLHPSNPYFMTLAIDDEFLILKKLNRKDEALKVLQAYHAQHPKNPIILFELGRMKSLNNDGKAAISFLQRAKQNLNEFFTKPNFVDLLNMPDFDRLRNMAEFRKLME